MVIGGMEIWRYGTLEIADLEIYNNSKAILFKLQKQSISIKNGVTYKMFGQKMQRLYDF